MRNDTQKRGEEVTSLSSSEVRSREPLRLHQYLDVRPGDFRFGIACGSFTLFDSLS